METIDYLVVELQLCFEDGRLCVFGCGSWWWRPRGRHQWLPCRSHAIRKVYHQPVAHSGHFVPDSCCSLLLGLDDMVNCIRRSAAEL